MTSTKEIDHISHSALRHFKKSPLHYLQYVADKGKVKSDAMMLGSATHRLFLEPGVGFKDYILLPSVDARTKEGKKQWAEAYQEAELTGKQIIKEELVEKAKPVAAQARKEAGFLLTGMSEVELRWKHPSGIDVLSFVDHLGDDKTIEFKTCKDADPNNFQRQAWFDGYVHQAALYWAGVKEKFNVSLPVYMVAVESSPPYGVSINVISVETLEKVYREVNFHISEFQAWVESGCPEESYGYYSHNKEFAFDIKYK